MFIPKEVVDKARGFTRNPAHTQSRDLLHQPDFPRPTGQTVDLLQVQQQHRIPYNTPIKGKLGEG